MDELVIDVLVKKKGKYVKKIVCPFCFTRIAAQKRKSGRWDVGNYGRHLKKKHRLRGMSDREKKKKKKIRCRSGSKTKEEPIDSKFYLFILFCYTKINNIFDDTIFKLFADQKSLKNKKKNVCFLLFFDLHISSLDNGTYSLKY